MYDPMKNAPWIVEPGAKKAAYHVLDSTNYIFAYVNHEDAARLIAAAPELLKACEGLIKDYCRLCVNSDEMNCGMDDPCDLIKSAEAAIAKAKGEA